MATRHILATDFRKGFITEVCDVCGTFPFCQNAQPVAVGYIGRSCWRTALPITTMCVNGGACTGAPHVRNHPVTTADSDCAALKPPKALWAVVGIHCTVSTCHGGLLCAGQGESPTVCTSTNGPPLPQHFPAKLTPLVIVLRLTVAPSNCGRRKVDNMLDEDLLVGPGRQARDNLRSLAYSTLADLVHHVKDRINLEQVSRVIQVGYPSRRTVRCGR